MLKVMHLVSYGIRRMAEIHKFAKEERIDGFDSEELMHLPYPGEKGPEVME